MFKEAHINNETPVSKIPVYFFCRYCLKVCNREMKLLIQYHQGKKKKTTQNNSHKIPANVKNHFLKIAKNTHPTHTRTKTQVVGFTPQR